MEIKLRAWDKEKKRMTILESQYVSEALHYQEKGWHVVMLYSGLYDKNGTEIADGDLLKADGYRPIIEVVFKKGAFVVDSPWFMPKFGNACLSDVLETPLDLRIVGNIYENAELLK